MYRRGLLKASDPPVRLPISQPPALLQTTGTPNVFRFGRRVADFIVQRDWLVKGAASPADGQEDALVKSIAVHARYLARPASLRSTPLAAMDQRADDVARPPSARSSRSPRKTRSRRPRSSTCRRSSPSAPSRTPWRPSSHARPSAG